ncbi:alpha/beta hydrolase-fold protein [Rhodococcus sp. HM1]|nr:alpha/beta hydrolase-fold protein [Rhodococcus sp. HM1]
MFDGKVAAVEIPHALAFDLLAERGVRVPLVVMIDSIDPATRSRELPCSAEFLEALTGDLLPWLRAEWNATGAADSVLVGGSSYGGLAATYAALHAPQHFGGAVSLSGSFWWPRPGMPGQPDETAQSVQRQLDDLATHGSRFWMTAGELEPRLIEENREARDLLRAKGFDVDYREFCGGYDYAHRRDALVAGAAALLGPAAAHRPFRG